MNKLYMFPTFLTAILNPKTKNGKPLFFYAQLSEFMKKNYSILLLTFLLLFAVNVFGQTNPSAQSIPYTQNFASLTGSSPAYPAGWQGWTITGSLSTSYPTAAPAANQAIAVITNTSTSAHVGDFIGKMGILNTSGTLTAICLAVNTTGSSSIQVSFDAATQRTENTRLNELGLQYRVGTSGTFTNVTGATYQNQMTPTNTTGTGAVNVVNVSVTLPSACDNQSVVQLRWVIRDVSGSGNRPGFSIDNISVNTSVTNFYWNGPTTTGTGASTGGTGTWNTSTTNWRSPTDIAGSASTAWTNSSNNIANFTAGTGTVTMGTSITANSTKIGVSGYTFAPNTTISLTSPVVLTNLLTVAPATSTTFTMSGVLSGAGGITQNGAGTTLLSGVSTHAGTTTVTSGTLQLGAAGSGANTPLGTTAAGTSVTSGAVLDLNGFTLTTAEGLTLNGTGISSGGALINSSGTAASYSGAIALGSNSSIGTTGNITLSGAITGASSLTKVGSGILILTAANSYSGGSTTVNGGILRAGITDALPTGTALTHANTSGVAFDLSGAFNQTIGSLSGGGGTGGNVTLGTGTLTVGNASSTTYSGVISGTSGKLTKQGAGTLTLAGANTYTGATTINNGVLSISSIANGGSASNIGQSTNAAANLVLGGGTLQYTGSTASTDRSFTLTGGTTSTIDVTNTLTISGSNTNTSGALTKAGAGTLILTGTYPHTGTNTFSAGELRLNPSGNITTLGAGTFTGGKLATTGITTGRTLTFSTLNVSAASTLALETTNVHTVTFTGAGTISTGTGLTISGWQGTYGVSNTGSAGIIKVGSSASALNCTQLAEIQFFDGTTNYAAALKSDGELVPVKTPTITAITPNSATAGDAGFTITVDGTNFINGISTVTWGGATRTTTFVSATQLTATISAADIASAGTVQVGVRNGCVNTATTETFTINAPTNSITLSPATQNYGDFCNSGANSVALIYTQTGTVTSPYIELSNSSASFASGTSNLGGTVTGSGPYTITANIPSGQSAGTYRIRINTSNSVISSDNGSNIIVDAPISITTQPSTPATACASFTGTISSLAVSGSNPTYQWKYSATGSGGWSDVTNATPNAGVTYSGDLTAVLSITSLTSTYYYQCVISNTGCGSVTSNAITVTVTPTPTQASALSTNTPTTDGFSAAWTAGTGSGTMVVVRQTSLGNALPSSGTSYTPNLAWASAGQIDANNRVIFRAAGTSAGPVTGLTAETQYTITAYEYNATGNCYNTTSPPSVTRYTLSTEPTAHAATFTNTVSAADQIDLTYTTPGSGADGYVILRRADNTSPTTTGVVDGVAPGSWSLPSGTVLVTANATGTTYSNTGLSNATDYCYLLIPFNWNGANAETYNYRTTTTVPTTCGTTPSKLSDITNDAGYGLTSNFDYKLWQTASPQSNTSDGLGMFNIIIRDGGSSSPDADNLPTILNAITFNCPNFANIRSASLFTTTGTHVASVAVTTANITFSGLSVTAPDNNTTVTELILRLSFNNTPATITDSTKIVFTITSATAASAATSSQFAAANAGGAVSDNDADAENRLSVRSTKLAFVQQPSNTSNGATMSPAVTVRGYDVNNIQDINFATNVSVTCSTPAALTAGGGPVTPSSGIATFSGIVHGTDGTYTMTASASGHTSIASNSYVIATITFPNGSYRSTSNGTLTLTGGGAGTPGGTATWETYNSGTNTWSTAGTPPNLGTTTTYIFIYNSIEIPLTTNSYGGADFSVMPTGVLTLNSTNPQTARNLHVYSGGVVNDNVKLTILSTGNFELDSNATFNFNVSSWSGSQNSSIIWNGTEIFHPHSNFVIKNHGSSTNDLFIPDDADVDEYTNPATGYKAMFGNLIYDCTAQTVTFQIFPPAASTKNLTHNDLIMRSGTGSNVVKLASSNLTTTIGHNIIMEPGFTGRNFGVYTTSATATVNIKGNIINNSSAQFRLMSSNTTSNVTMNVDSNIVLSSTGLLSFNATNGSTHTSTLKVKGDITVATGAYITNASTTVKGSLIFNGTGDGSTADQTQVVNIASTNAARNQYINFNIANGAYVQLGANLELGTNSKVTDSLGGTLDFGFSGATPLNITMYASGAAFESRQQSTLKITSADGLYDEFDRAAYVAAGVTVNTGNVQGILKTNRSISPIATFWYIGNANQKTGDAPNVSLSGSADAKVVICDLTSNSYSLTPTVSFGVTSATTVNTTYGGHLYIKKGQFRETTTEYIFGEGGTLRMEPGTYYYIPKGNVDLAASDADPIPRMSGLINSPTSQYYLNGGTIELAGTGSSHGFQSLRGNTINPKEYINVTYSGANTLGTDFKNLTSTVVIDSALTITGDAIVNCHGGAATTPQSFTGDGGLVMSGTNSRIRIRKLNVEQPELIGDNVAYSLTGGTVEFYSTDSTQQQLMRGNYTSAGSNRPLINYYNIDINAVSSNWSVGNIFADAGNVNMSTGFKLTGTLNVNAPAVFRMDEADAISNGTGTSQVVNIKDYAGLLYGSPNGITASDITTSGGNIRTSGTRNFSTNAGYGFIGNGNMVTGNGLPAITKGLYVYKYNSSDRVTLTNTVRADSVLKMNSGHIVTSTNRIELGKDVSNRGMLDYTAGYVVGNMRRWYDNTNTGVASGLFPLGVDSSGFIKNRKYLIEYSADPTGGYLDVNFNEANMGTAGLPITGIPAAGTCTNPFDVTTTEDEGYWIATPQAGTLGDGAYTLAITGERFNKITDMCQMTLLKRVGGGNWTAPVGSIHQQPSGTYLVPTVSRTLLTGFSNFGFGGGPPNPLPVELTSFTGTCNDGSVKINWSTASEFNSREFIIQRSDNGVNYTTVATVPSAGNSNQPRNYSITDTSVTANSNYYRLIEVDIFGIQAIYSFIQVRCSEVNGINIFFTQPKVVVELNSNKDKQVGFNVYEVSGKLLHQENKQIVRGYNRFDLSIKNKLANGIYIIQMIDGDKATSTKVMVH